MKIGVVGAGAIGLTLAAGLGAANDVVVLVRRPDVAGVLQRDGLVIERDDAVRRVAVRAASEPRALADCDAVLVAVKAHATADALAPLHGLLAPHALVASVQNGIDNAAAAHTALPDARIVAGSTSQGAMRLGDNRIRPVNDGTTTFGNDASRWPTSGDLAAAFAAAGLDARVVDDIDAVLWRKLVVNAAVNAACALTGRRNGAVVDDDDLRPVARALAEEAAAVARAEGIDIPDAWAVVVAAASSSRANRNSMLEDIAAGRPSEIDQIAGALIRRARAHGIAVPITETLARLVHARERA
ncbi:MAG TPA: 2-dehydropantoate 2-reductase [Candidatus Elarobacter sp.]